MTAESGVSAAPLFDADADQVRWLGDRILKAIAGSSPRHVLDIGCGDGSLIAYLASALPTSTFVGVDLSAANVQRARTSLQTLRLEERATISCGDYLTLQRGQFDLVLAASTLQGIATTTPALAAKLAADTAPAGLLIHLTPYRCAYNTALNIVRRVLRLARGRTGDRIILTVARILHPDKPIDLLTQRVPYMYLVLRHFEDELRAELETRHGFRCEHLEEAPHSSAGQPKHRLAMLRAPRV